uniref:Uncharacterized protein n=1 Tax=Cucumis sativus TaxID=3659 RepID=A0A0A0L285_CUCSA
MIWKILRRSGDASSNDKVLSVPIEDKLEQNQFKVVDDDDDINLSKAPIVLSEEQNISNGHNELTPERIVDFVVLSDKALGPSVLNTGENGVADHILATPEISEIEISTPPPSSNEMISEYTTHSRKKWMSDENSPKAPKGFRKLLFFGPDDCLELFVEIELFSKPCWMNCLNCLIILQIIRE